MNKTSPGSLGGEAQEGSKAGAQAMPHVRLLLWANSPRCKKPVLPQRDFPCTSGSVLPLPAGRERGQKVPTLYHKKEWTQFYPESNWMW